MLNIKDYRVDTVVLANEAAFNNNTYDPVTDKWTVNLTAPLSMDQQAILTVNYEGYMLDDMAGFYKSSYKENGQDVWLGTTQFQQTDARRAFPCFDVSLILF